VTPAEVCALVASGSLILDTERRLTPNRFVSVIHRGGAINSCWLRVLNPRLYRPYRCEHDVADYFAALLGER